MGHGYCGEGMVKSASAQGLRDKVSAVQPQFLIFGSCDKWSTLAGV